MGIRLLAAIWVLAGLLVGCNGQAPILTCHAPCAKSDEYRDLFCVCQKKTPPAPVQLPRPTETPGSPYLDFAWEATPSCGTNRRYYLLNSANTKLAVKVTRKVRGQDKRAESEYTVNANALLRADGVDLGLEALESDCFDQDFTISTWRQPQHATAKESALARLDESKVILLERQRYEVAQLETHKVASGGPTSLPLLFAQLPNVTVHSNAQVTQAMTEYQPIDCAKACEANDGAQCPLRGFPPDQDKLKSLRDRLRSPPQGTEYKAADIYTVFGLTKSSCNRSDAPLINNKVYNNGQYCSLPMLLRQTETDPKIALHLPTAVKGDRVMRSTSAGISFGAGTAQPILLFAEADLQGDFGGNVSEATASDKGVYYQTSGGCIFVGLK